MKSGGGGLFKGLGLGVWGSGVIGPDRGDICIVFVGWMDGWMGENGHGYRIASSMLANRFQDISEEFWYI